MLPLQRDNWQYDMGWVLCIVEYFVMSYCVRSAFSKRLAGVWIYVELGEVAARYVQAYAVARFEEITSRAEKIDSELIDFPRRHELLLFESIAVSCPYNTI